MMSFRILKFRKLYKGSTIKSVDKNKISILGSKINIILNPYHNSKKLTYSYIKIDTICDNNNTASNIINKNFNK